MKKLKNETFGALFDGELIIVAGMMRFKFTVYGDDIKGDCADLSGTVCPVKMFRTGQVYTVGRDKENDYARPDARFLSRRHFSLIVERESGSVLKFTVTDRGSVNGTVVEWIDPSMSSSEYIAVTGMEVEERNITGDILKGREQFQLADRLKSGSGTVRFVTLSGLNKDGFIQAVAFKRDEVLMQSVSMEDIVRALQKGDVYAFRICDEIIRHNIEFIYKHGTKIIEDIVPAEDAGGSIIKTAQMRGYMDREGMIWRLGETTEEDSSELFSFTIAVSYYSLTAHSGVREKVIEGYKLISSQNAPAGAVKRLACAIEYSSRLRGRLSFMRPGVSSQKMQ